MYLSNVDIRKVIEEMNFETFISTEPFDPDLQIQICSIDLRLSTEFWKQKTVRFPIDLRKSKLVELSPRRHWKKVVLAPDQSIILRPNEFILGHTLEKFTIPIKYAGKVNTRSDFARMGIETNSATDFMNPGWRGFIPLEIINKSKNSIKLFPLLGIVQIMLIPLSSDPDTNYGVKLGSKYQDDDGGPSKWWRDKLFMQIKGNSEKNLSNEMLNILIDKFSSVDDEGLYRFEKFFETLKSHQIDNADNLIEKFCYKERRKERIQTILVWAFPIICSGLLGLSLKILLEKDIRSIFYFIWGFTLVWFTFTIYRLFFRERKTFYSNI